MARNDSNAPLRIPRNPRLGSIIETDYENAFHVREDSQCVFEIALEIANKPNWFKRALTTVIALLPAARQGHIRGLYYDDGTERAVRAGHL